MNARHETKIAYSVEEAAEATSMSRSRIYQAIASGALKSFKSGRLRRVSAKALEAFIAELERQSEGKGRAAA